jgi:four helix bundle protein
LKVERWVFKKESPMPERTYDLEERLLDYAAQIVRLIERLPDTRAGNHIAGQLLRSGTSPLPNHGEAEGAESKNDFIHKLGICHKELRESRRWLKLIRRVPLLTDDAALEAALNETDELVRIFAASIRTARSSGCRENGELYTT